MSNLETLEKAIKSNTKIIWIESPTNPTLKLCDIEEVCKIAKKNNVLAFVDNTFSSPLITNPILLGADVVMHSCTKYIGICLVIILGGHSDITMGVLLTNNKELHEKLFFAAKSIGGCPSNFDCYLA